MTTANIVVANIDKVAPVLLAPSYSSQFTTNQDVIVTITSAENLAAPVGWIKTPNGSGFDYKKTYAANTVEAIIFSDTAGNNTIANITVNNIDKTPPVLLAAAYSTLATTSGPVAVTISSVENLSAPAGWVKS